MSRDEFDVYKLIIEDTNQLNARRQRLDSLYVSLITLVLSGEAYLAYASTLNSWLAVILTTGAGITGITILLRWRQALRDLDKILRNRYEFLRKMEANAPLANLNATLFTEEYNKIYKPRTSGHFRSATARLQVVFVAVFLLIPLFLGVVTFANTSADVPVWLHQMVDPIVTPSSR